MTGTATSQLVFDRSIYASDAIRTPWGEQIHFRVSATQSSESLSIADYTCPVNFGPPRHIHLAADEVLEMREGRIAVWLPDRTFVAEPGDLVLLPRGIAHTWRSCGDVAPKMVVTMPDGDLERWFQEMAKRQLPPDEVDEIMNALKSYRIEPSGPVLTDEEVRAIVSANAPSERQGIRHHR